MLLRVHYGTTAPRCGDHGDRPISYRVYNTQTSHYSSILNKNEHGYGEMPKVEETLVSYLYPETSSSTKSPVLRTKPVRTISALVAKAY